MQNLNEPEDQKPSYDELDCSTKSAGARPSPYIGTQVEHIPYQS